VAMRKIAELRMVEMVKTMECSGIWWVQSSTIHSREWILARPSKIWFGRDVRQLDSMVDETSDVESAVNLSQGSGSK